MTGPQQNEDHQHISHLYFRLSDNIYFKRHVGRSKKSLDTQNYSDQVDEGWETVLGVDGINNLDVIDDNAMLRDQWRSGCVRKEEKVD